MANISVTDTAVSTLFEQLAAPAKLVGMDYASNLAIYDNLQRLYNRLYPMMMLDFVHQLDYKVFVKLTKSHTHKVVGYTLAVPSTTLAPFRPLTRYILMATAFPEPWTGIPAKLSMGGMVLSPMFTAMKTVADVSIQIDKTKKTYI